jgi:hypothetical protein
MVVRASRATAGGRGTPCNRAGRPPYPGSSASAIRFCRLSQRVGAAISGLYHIVAVSSISIIAIIVRYDAMMKPRRRVMSRLSLPARSLRGRSASLRTVADGAGYLLRKWLIWRALLVMRPAISGVEPIFLPALRERRSGWGGLAAAGQCCRFLGNRGSAVAGRCPGRFASHRASSPAAVQMPACRSIREEGLGGCGATADLVEDYKGICQSAGSHLESCVRNVLGSPCGEVDPGVDQHIGQITDQLQQQPNQGEDVEGAKHDRVVTVDRRLEAEQTETVERKDHLDQ